jgi:DNA processing protein
MNERAYWLGFSLVPEIGPKRLAYLRQHFNSLYTAWHANEAQLRAAGLSGTVLQSLLYARDHTDLEAQLARVEQVGARLLTLIDADYPSALRNIPNVPVVLYVKGALTAEDERALTVVGTRRVTEYGRDVTRLLTRQLVAQRFTIVSGLAEGVDTIAHRTALESGGRTLAVLGCGIDRVYPSSNSALSEHILRNGALMSEFPLGTPPEARNFPRRNRILSGLSLGVLVTEAPAKSGALITANTAAEQGREVFAVPGSILTLMHGGTNRLIQEGAKLVSQVADIVQELNVSNLPNAPAQRHAASQTAAAQQTLAQPLADIPPTTPTQRPIPAALTAQALAAQTQPPKPTHSDSAGLAVDAREARILETLGNQPLHVDEVVRQSELSTSMVTALLTVMELKGFVQVSDKMICTRLV